MADRLTQLQDCINQVLFQTQKLHNSYICINTYTFQQAEHFCNSIGILQQFATPSKFPGFDRSGSQTPQQQTQEDYVQLFTTLIARCSKDIDTLIESLPCEESSTDLQVVFIVCIMLLKKLLHDVFQLQSLRILEEENQEAAEKLETVVSQGQDLLEQIQAALSDIAQAQLNMQHLSTNATANNQ